MDRDRSAFGFGGGVEILFADGVVQFPHADGAIAWLVNMGEEDGPFDAGVAGPEGGFKEVLGGEGVFCGDGRGECAYEDGGEGFDMHDERRGGVGEESNVEEKCVCCCTRVYQEKERKVSSWFAVEAVVWLIGDFYFFEELGLYLYLIL